MGYVIGIDGGGTKTEAVMADETGHIMAYVTKGPTNLNTTSEKDVTITFQAIFNHFKQINEQAFQQVTTVFAGISGAGNERIKSQLKTLVSISLPSSAKLLIEPDTVNALYSGTYGKPGIVQISGTGSITYGMNDQGLQDRVGGWGYLLGDEGSGYDIGRQGIMAALKYADGRGEKTALLPLIYDYFQVSHARDLIDQIYQAPVPKNEISPVAKLVFHACKIGDRIAKDIIMKTRDEIIQNILTLHKKLFEPDEKMPVILCGGIFNDRQLLPQMIEKKIYTITNTLSIQMPSVSPVTGSVIGAYIQKRNLSKEVLQNLQKSDHLYAEKER